jgi:hypothetical protein
MAKVKVKVKLSRYSPEQVLRVPGFLVMAHCIIPYIIIEYDDG